MTRFLTVFNVIALVSFAGIILFFPALSGFPAFLLKAGFGAAGLYCLDKYGMPEIDTIDELQKGNIAYALFLLAYSVLFLAAAIGS